MHLFFGTASGVTVTSPDNRLVARGDGLPGFRVADDALGSAVLLADLNGDGCSDLLMGDAGHANDSGVFTALYGTASATGALTGPGTFLSQETASGNKNLSVAGEGFGSSLAAGDFDGDGINDVAVGAPFETVTSTGEARGAVGVFYGSTAGVNGSARKPQYITQDSPNVPGASEDNDAFGFALAADDVTGDGIDDLVVGVPVENNDAGIVQVLPGSATGLLAAPGLTFSQNTAGVPGTSEGGDEFGYSVATGDVDGDGHADVVVGTPGENTSRGAVSLLRSTGTNGALSGTGAGTVTQDTAGVTGVAGADDGFGAAVTVATLDTDAFRDVAVGTPGDDIGTVPGAGSVTVLRGSSTGMTVAGFGGTRFSQDTAGVPGAAEQGDLFGWSVTGTRAFGGGVDTLVVGSPAEIIGGLSCGSVTVLGTTSTGPTGTGSRSLDVGPAAVQGDRENGATFGWSVD